MRRKVAAKIHPVIRKLLVGALTRIAVGVAFFSAATYLFQPALGLVDGLGWWLVEMTSIGAYAVAVIAIWMALARIVASYLWSRKPAVPPSVQHITSKAARAAIDRDGVLMPGSHLVLLGSAVYVQASAKSAAAYRIKMIAQMVSLSERPPFLHLVSMNDLEAIPIRVSNVDRLIPYSFRGGVWAVWGPIARNTAGDFEI